MTGDLLEAASPTAAAAGAVVVVLRCVLPQATPEQAHAVNGRGTWHPPLGARDPSVPRFLSTRPGLVVAPTASRWRTRTRRAVICSTHWP